MARGTRKNNGSVQAQLSPEDLALLSAEELAALEKEAEAEATEDHKEELKARVKSALKASKRQALKKASGQEEQMRDIMLDLAPHSDRIVIDGTVYFHGQAYTVTDSVYRTLTEIVARGWEHEHEVGNANQKAYRAPRHAVIGPQHANVAAAQLLRV